MSLQDKTESRWHALGTRPDISYAVGLLSRFNSDPRTRHLTAAKRVPRYLKRTKDLKLEYKQTGSREALWIRQLLLHIKPTKTIDTTTIYADNQAALKHVRTEGITARTKHFDIRLQHSRDNQAKGTITFEYIKSDDNTADIFTKALPLPAHQRHPEGLGLTREIADWRERFRSEGYRVTEIREWRRHRSFSKRVFPYKIGFLKRSFSL